MEWILVLALGVFAGVIGGTIGFGTSIILLPVLVLIFGPREAVPMMAITALMANLSRVLVWWRDVDWKACAAYSVTGIPCAALGARTLLSMSPHSIEMALGVFFILMIPARRWLQARGFRARLWHLSMVGAVIGFVTGIVVSTGPVNTPFFLAYGLTRGAFLSTEAAGSLAVYVSKAIVFNQLGALPWPILSKGVIVGCSIVVGSWLARRIVLSLADVQFRLLMEALMLAAGITMLGSALL